METFMTTPQSKRRRFLGFTAAVAAATPIFDRLVGTRIASAQQPATGQRWSVQGLYVEACRCEVACPCIFGSAPSAGYCDGLLGWHVDSGRFGDTALDGFIAAMALHSPGHLMQGNWKVALYIDQRASPAQREALEAIFSGKAGGHLAGLAPLIGEVLPTKSVPIDFYNEGKRRRMVIADLAEWDVTAIKGQGGADVTVANPPLTLAPNYPTTIAKSTRMMYHDHGFTWELSEKGGLISPFSYASA